MHTLVALPWLLLWCDHISLCNYCSDSLDALLCAAVSIKLIHKLMLVVTTRNLALRLMKGHPIWVQKTTTLNKEGINNV
jgi:hypothetical protein